MAPTALVEKQEVRDGSKGAEIVRLVPTRTPYRPYRSSPEDFARELAVASENSSVDYAALAHYYY